jgi:hypothetical protein
VDVLRRLDREFVRLPEPPLEAGEAVARERVRL